MNDGASKPPDLPTELVCTVGGVVGCLIVLISTYLLPKNIRLRLPRRTGGRPWIETARGEIGAHLLVGGLDEPRVLEDQLHFVGGGVATDVLFLKHVSQMRPVADAVTDVIQDLPLSLGALLVAE